MAVLHISEAELARDIASLLDRVQSGAEVVIERNARPVAVLRAAEPRRRRLSEIMAALPEDSPATIDPDFAADVQAFIDSHREPLHPPEWD
jgi:prevent-host-death family protein